MRLIRTRAYADEYRADHGRINAYIAKTAAYTIPAKGFEGTVFTNRGASGSVTFTLPIAPKAGDRYAFAKSVSDQTIVVSSAGGLAIKGPSGGTTGSTLTDSTTEFGFVELESDGYVWFQKAAVGTWALT